MKIPIWTQLLTHNGQLRGSYQVMAEREPLRSRRDKVHELAFQMPRISKFFQGERTSGLAS